MSSIGSYNFITVKGAVETQQDRLEPFSRPGVNGESFQSLGNRAQMSTFTSTEDLPFFATAANRLSAFSSMVGYVVTVIDDLGNVWTNMLVMSVSQLSAKAIIRGSGGLSTNPAALQTVQWEFKRLI